MINNYHYLRRMSFVWKEMTASHFRLNLWLIIIHWLCYDQYLTIIHTPMYVYIFHLLVEDDDCLVAHWKQGRGYYSFFEERNPQLRKIQRNIFWTTTTTRIFLRSSGKFLWIFWDVQGDSISWISFQKKRVFWIRYCRLAEVDFAA